MVETIPLANNARNYIDPDVFTCTEYRYKLVLKRADNTIYNSNYIYGRLNANITDALIGLDVSKGYYANKVTLAWNAQKANLIEAYQIYRRPFGDIDYKLVKSVRDGSLTWVDDNTDAGKYYEYKLIATATCVDRQIRSDSLTSLGFRQPTGTVAGQISYTGGTAVPGVKVLVNPNTEGLGRGTAINMDGQSTIKTTLSGKFDFSKGFTIESWVNLKRFTHPDGPYPYFMYNNAGFIFAFFDQGEAPTPPPTNVALKKPATQSSNYVHPCNPVAGLANDGNKSGNFIDCSVTQTNLDQNAWWKVDLGIKTSIAHIDLYNRTDCCGERLSNFGVYVSDNGLDGNWTKVANFPGISPAKNVFNLNNVSGRYVKIQLNGLGYMSLAEVEVWGAPYQAPVALTKEIDFNVGNYDSNSNPVFQTLRYDMLKDSLKIWNKGGAGDWNHISLNYNKDTVKIYINGRVVAKQKSLSLATIDFDFEFAKNLFGSMDEIRVWNRSLSDDETARFYKIVTSGNEPGLILNYHLDEGLGAFVFDASQNNDGFNGNHGVIQGSESFDPNTTASMFSDIIPPVELLSRYTYTDEVGAYLIKGIPYRNEGELFRITPVFGQHTFDPPSKTVFLGDGQYIQNNVNFTDISSFQATGRIIYRGTDFPVDSVYIKIDGSNAFGRDRLPIFTNSSGEFTVAVPIGSHFLSFEKNGHAFQSPLGNAANISTSKKLGPQKSSGYYPGIDSLGLPLLHDYQEAVTNLTFYDDTKVLLAGRIVGGTNEGNKKIGFGLSKNNIGMATVKLTPVKDQFSLKPNTTQNNFIQFRTDSLSGEYKLLVIPEEFNVASISINADKTSAFDFSDPAYKAKVNLRQALIAKTEIDTVYKDEITEGISKSVIDSTRMYKYNLRRDWIYRSNPTIDVTSRKSAWLADTTYEYTDATSVTSIIKLKLANNANQFDFPVYTQLRRYPWNIWVYEKYTHAATKKSATVDVTDATITVSNNLASPNTPLVIESDSTGHADYVFFGGFPNTTLDNTTPVNSFTKTASIIVKTGSGKTANWPAQGGPYRAYLLGGYPVGNNFVTTGPNKVDFILRDPPGSGSSAKLEKGAKVSTTRTTSVENGNEGEGEKIFNWGIKSSIQVGGPTLLVGKDIISKNELGITVAHSENFIKEDQTVSSTTFTESYSTSSEAGFVGKDGDVFIGNSTNIVYGTSLDLGITEPINIPTGGTKLPTNKNVNGKTLTLGIRESVRLNPEFNTFFIYSQKQIIDNVIPGLKKLRNLLFTNQPNHYKLVFTDSEDPKFATNNDDPLWGSDATTGIAVHQGKSYQFTPFKALAPNWEEDSVRYYNNQVKNWESFLAQNEQEKLNGKPNAKHSNISFDSGTAYESSVETSAETQATSTFEWTLNPGFSIGTEATIDDYGPKLKLTEKFTHKEVATDVKNTENTQTITINLADTDDDNFYTVDILDCQAGNGPIFRTKGGQSSCPYEGEARTQYYNKGGDVLSKAMVQIYNPVITADIASLQGVPEDQPAIFTLNLSNESAVKVDQWLLLKTDNASNPNGAKLFVDGSPLSGSGITIKIPAGQVITKTLEVFKGRADVNDYSGIKIQLKPTCEDDEALGVVEIGAGFVPACSKVVINAPKNNWIVNVYNRANSEDVNSSVILPIKLTGFNANLSSFKSISLQYKDVSSTTWSTLITYFKKQTDFDAFKETKFLIGSSTSLNFNWDVKDLVDREYEIRAITVCVDGSQFESMSARGIKDTKRPGPFGAPQPADGVLAAGDEVLIQFDESIISGLLLANKQFVTAKGVLNGTILANSASIEFNGLSDQAIVGDGLTLGNASFTIEGWVRRNTATAGVFWSFGEDATNQLKLGFDASGKIIFSDAAKNYTGKLNYQLGSWYHFAFIYDATANKISIYQDDKLDLDPPANATIASFPTGRMSFGFDLAQKSSFFSGRLRDFRIWSRAVPFDVLYAGKSATLSGAEPGLLGYWLMDEKIGIVTRDRAHLRDAVVNATWNVEPKGKSALVAGGNAYISLDGRNINIGTETDFTVEFWFNGAPGAEQCLLSSGRGIAGELYKPTKSLAITASATGVQLASNGKLFQLTSQNLLDNSWHHLALVINRRGTARSFIDGNLVNETNVEGLGGIGEDYLFLGVRRWRETLTPATYKMDQFFQGAFDEVRLWKTARTADQIAAYRNNRIATNEVGLTGYYPFESYIRDANNGLNLVATLADQWTGDKQTTKAPDAVFNGPANFYDQTPTIGLERPVKDLKFDLAVNGDKVLVTLNEPLSLIQNCLLEFTIRDATDLHNNVLASPVQWSAFVNRNQLKWETSEVKLEKELGVTKTFTARIRNFGGIAQSFSITNLPAWLTASPASGTLNALASTEITFTIDQALNPGTYNQDLYLSADNGVNERLALTLRVFNNPPNWIVFPEKYELGMNAIGLLRINGLLSRNPKNLIGVFKNGICRGVGNLTYIPQTDQYLVFLDIYGDAADADTNFDVKVWNDDLGQINSGITIIDGATSKKFITFVSGQFLGTTKKPVIFSADNTLEQSIQIVAGWNWLAFNLSTPNQKTVAKLFESLNSTPGDVVKSVSLFDEFATSTGWFGALTAGGGITNVASYQLKSANKDTLVYSGVPLLPSATPITIGTGWNWIGYVPTFSLPVSNALANLTPTANDVVKGQRDFAIYDTNLGWIGSLKSLKPSAGYKYYSNDTKLKTFTYPNQSLFTKTKNPEFIDRSPETVNRITPESYETNMNLVAIVNGLAGKLDDYWLVAKNADIAVGSIAPVMVKGVMYYFNTIFGQKKEEKLSFYLLNHLTGDQVELIETLNYQADQMVGSLNAPFVFEVKEKTILVTDMQVWPQPFSDALLVSFGLNKPSEVVMELFDLNGRSLGIIYKGLHSAGKSTVSLSERTNTPLLQAAGVYTLRMRTNETVQTKVIIKQ